MEAAVAALLGTAIGVLGSFGVAWIQQRHQTRREVAKMAVDLAIRDYEQMLAHAAPGAAVPPIAVYVDYHAKVVRAVADDSFDPKTIRAIDGKQRQILEAIIEGERTRRSERG